LFYIDVWFWLHCVDGVCVGGIGGDDMKECKNCGLMYKNLPHHLKSCHKVDWQQVRTMILNGSSNREVAEQFNVSQSMISNFSRYHKLVELGKQYQCPTCFATIDETRKARHKLKCDIIDWQYVDANWKQQTATKIAHTIYCGVERVMGYIKNNPAIGWGAYQAHKAMRRTENYTPIDGDKVALDICKTCKVLVYDDIDDIPPHLDKLIHQRIDGECLQCHFNNEDYHTYTNQRKRERYYGNQSNYPETIADDSGL
jgi:hypothetical protein